MFSLKRKNNLQFHFPCFLLLSLLWTQLQFLSLPTKDTKVLIILRDCNIKSCQPNKLSSNQEVCTGCYILKKQSRFSLTFLSLTSCLAQLPMWFWHDFGQKYSSCVFHTEQRRAVSCLWSSSAPRNKNNLYKLMSAQLITCVPGCLFNATIPLA